jgi:hypothetical protein
MRVGILKTDNGPHAAEDWAVATADRVLDMVQVDKDSPRVAGLEAAKRKFENAIIDILEKGHGAVHTVERAAIASSGADRLSAPLDAAAHVDDPFAAIVAASKGTPLEAHFAKPEIQSELKVLLAQHFATSMDIERSWHADRLLKADPSDEHAKAYQTARNNHGAGDVHLHIDKYRAPATTH